jgi:hypothetical protein
MAARLHIFRRTSRRSSIWIAAVKGIAEAKKYLARQPYSSGEEYFLYDTQAEKFVSVIRPAFRNATGETVAVSK